MRRWPHTRRLIDGFQCARCDKKEWEFWAKKGVEKIWFVQMKKGHDFWYSEPGIYVSRTEAKAVAVRLASTLTDLNATRIVRWTSPARRAHQYSQWWAYIKRNNPTKGREISEWRKEWIQAHRSLAEVKMYLNRWQSQTRASRRAQTSPTS